MRLNASDRSLCERSFSQTKPDRAERARGARSSHAATSAEVELDVAANDVRESRIDGHRDHPTGRFGALDADVDEGIHSCAREIVECERAQCGGVRTSFVALLNAKTKVWIEGKFWREVPIGSESDVSRGPIGTKVAGASWREQTRD